MMYPLLDSTTISRRAAEGRQAAERARQARRARPRAEHDGRRHRVRHALGTTLVRAGMRLIHA